MYVIDANLVRRQPNTWQKANLVLEKIKTLDDIERIKEEKEKERGFDATDFIESRKEEEYFIENILPEDGL